MSQLRLLKMSVRALQRLNTEVRRLQNVIASDHAIAYIGIVDTTWSSTAEPTEALHLRTPHHGVIPVSAAAPSNWHLGNPKPFVTSSQDDPDIEPQDIELRNVWLYFRVTSDHGFLCIDPNGDRIFTSWVTDSDSGTRDGHVSWRSFPEERAAQEWASRTAVKRTTR